VGVCIGVLLMDYMVDQVSIGLPDGIEIGMALGVLDNPVGGNYPFSPRYLLHARNVHSRSTPTTCTTPPFPERIYRLLYIEARYRKERDGRSNTIIEHASSILYVSDFT
jgi:hypothetical protein